MKSITMKLCLLLIVLVSSISVIIGIWSINDTNKVIQKEMGRMNSQVLSQVANNISIQLSNVDDIGKNISEDNQLIKILSTPKSSLIINKDELKRDSIYIEGLLYEQVWKYGKFNMKPELYVVCENGQTFSTFSKTKYDINEIKKEDWYKEIVEANGETILISTVEEVGGIGPYKNIIRMGRLIKNLITGENLGVLIMDISEKMIYDCYNKLLTGEINIFVVDSDANIISTKYKSYIGMNYNSKIDYGKTIEENNSYSILSREDIKYMRMSSELDKYDWRIIEEIPLEIVKQPIIEITNRFLVTLILVIFMFFIIIYKISAWITKPVLNMKDAMKRVIEGDLTAKVVVGREDEIGQLQTSYNDMVNWLDASINEIKEKELQKRVAELSFLQAQINPHFLYNTLSGIRSLISMDKKEETEEMLYRFTKLLRRVLPKSSEMIALEEELNIIKDYIELQKIRYPGGFEVNIKVEEGIYKTKVPCLILQPVIENAIFYSMESLEGKGRISITGYRDEDKIYIKIKDNGKGIPDDKIESMFNNKESINRVGLINVHERIQLIYGINYGIKIESAKGVGTTVIFVLPGNSA